MLPTSCNHFNDQKLNTNFFKNRLFWPITIVKAEPCSCSLTWFATCSHFLGNTPKNQSHTSESKFLVFYTQVYTIQ